MYALYICMKKTNIPNPTYTYMNCEPVNKVVGCVKPMYCILLQFFVIVIDL